MSFSSDAKEEISRRLPARKCCMRATAAAMTRFCGSVRRDKGISLYMLCEKASTAKTIYTLLRDTFDVSPEIQSVTQNRLGRKHRYQVVLSEGEATAVLKTAGLIGEDGSWQLSRKLPKGLKACCKRAYITGAFLASGSVSDPRTGYHLEFITDQAHDAEGILELLDGQGLRPKSTVRKNRYVVYIKEGACLAKLLTIMGATNALLSMESLLVMKNVRNNVNRAVNCETANLGRSVDASFRHIENIRFLSDNNFLADLPMGLQEIAKLRLENPEANLQDLSDLMPELSKSGINHRLRKLDKIALELRKEKGDV